jgi:hypothetical protein
MIGRVLNRGKRVYGLLWYLYSPGKTGRAGPSVGGRPSPPDQ